MEPGLSVGVIVTNSSENVALSSIGENSATIAHNSPVLFTFCLHILTEMVHKSIHINATLKGCIP